MTSENPNQHVRSAIVTGGSGGIGRAVAERLAADGLAVVVAYAGNAARAEETVRAITDAGGRASAFRGASSKFGAPSAAPSRFARSVTPRR